MDQAIKKVLAAFKSKDEALRIINNNDFELSPEDLIIATKFVEEMVWPDEAEKKAADEAEKKEKKRISNRRQKATRKKKEDDQQAQIKFFLKEVMASLTEAIEEESQKQQIDEREEVGSSSMDRIKYTREERGKGILVEEVSLPVVDEDAVEEMEVEKLTENDKPPVTEDELRITSLASGENNITKMEIPQNQSSTAHEPGNDLEPKPETEPTEPIEGREDKKPNHSESGSHKTHGSNVLGAGSTAPPQEDLSASNVKREEVESSSMGRRRYTMEEKGKGIQVEDAVKEMEAEKLMENEKPPVVVAAVTEVAVTDELMLASLASCENNITKMEIPQNQSSTAHEPGNDLEPEPETEPIEGREDKKPNHSESGSHNPHGSNVLGAGSTVPPQEQGAFWIPLLTTSQKRNGKKKEKLLKLRQEIEEAAVEIGKQKEELKNLKEKKKQQHLENLKNQEKYQKTITDMLVPLEKHVSDCVVDCKVAITQMLVSTQHATLAISNMQEATARNQQCLTLGLLQQFSACINTDTATKVACISCLIARLDAAHLDGSARPVLLYVDEVLQRMLLVPGRVDIALLRSLRHSLDFLLQQL